MKSMDEIYLIKKLTRKGYTTRAIAQELQISRGTVLKYQKAELKIKSPVKKELPKKIECCIPHIENLLLGEISLSSRKHKLTAKRIHTLIIEGKLAPDVKPITCSERTVERVVRQVRERISKVGERQHLKLVHDLGKAQLDFGEIKVLGPNGATRQYMLVISFPYSNMRMAHVLPAQNFECLAYGLGKLLERCGRVPTSLRCDNMSTAVRKIVRRDKLSEHEGVYDSGDHPRLLTDNFKILAMHYGFSPEFCNAASGNEKGSVENAVGWFRQNFFTPLIRFDGDYDALNEELAGFCLRASKELHYKSKKKTIEELFSEERAVMGELPAQPFDACNWSQGTVTKDCRVQFETNEYQVNATPGTKVNIKRYWNRLIFMNTYGEKLGESPRSYDNHTDTIDWKFEVEMYVKRPSAFNSSFLSKIMSESLKTYLLSLSAPKRAILFKALLQRLKAGGHIVDELQKLADAAYIYGSQGVEDTVSGYRGAEDIGTDSIRPMSNLPSNLAGMSLPPSKTPDMLKAMWGGDLE